MAFRRTRQAVGCPSGTGTQGEPPRVPVRGLMA